LTTGTDKRTMTIWDADTGKPLHTMQTDNAVAEVADVSPDGKWLLTGGGTKDDGDFDLHLWRLPNEITP
jgi:WD40 repeat protein